MNLHAIKAIYFFEMHRWARTIVQSVAAPVIDGLALELAADGTELVYAFDAQAESTGIAELMRALTERGIDFKDLRTEESSLEDIFVSLVRGARA